MGEKRPQSKNEMQREIIKLHALLLKGKELIEFMQAHSKQQKARIEELEAEVKKLEIARAPRGL